MYPAHMASRLAAERARNARVVAEHIRLAREARDARDKQRPRKAPGPVSAVRYWLRQT